LEGSRSKVQMKVWPRKHRLYSATYLPVFMMKDFKREIKDQFHRSDLLHGTDKSILQPHAQLQVLQKVSITIQF